MALPVCKYGASCYRKNPDHLRKFSHPQSDEKQQRTRQKRKLSTSPVATSVCETEVGSTHTNAEQSESINRPSDAKILKLSGGDDSEVVGATSDDGVRQLVRKMMLVQMPDDFYHFWDFCASINPSAPERALLSSGAGLELVGPFHILSGRLGGHLPWTRCVLHCRYFYDPPEFVTVLKSTTEDGFHIGYFRDEPDSDVCLLASNNASENCQFRIEGENIFQVVKRKISERCKEKSSLSSEQRQKLLSLDTRLTAKARDLGLAMDDPATISRKRNKLVLSKCFHKLGVVVPYDKKTEVGYRPLPLTDSELRRLLDKIASCTDDEAERDRRLEPLQEVVTLVQFANDECDYGMGLELGLDLFSHGCPALHSMVRHLLPLAYELLQREAFAQVIREHLKHRNTTPLDLTD